MRVATLVASDFEFGSLRMFQLGSEGKLDHHYALFRDWDEACTWLGLDPARFPPPDDPGGPEEPPRA